MSGARIVNTNTNTELVHVLITRLTDQYHQTTGSVLTVKDGETGMKSTNWPPIEEVEHLRWSNNRTQYHSIAYGFCEAQDSCEQCDYRMRLLCSIKKWIDKIRVKIIKRHYGVNGW